MVCHSPGFYTKWNVRTLHSCHDTSVMAGLFPVLQEVNQWTQFYLLSGTPMPVVRDCAPIDGKTKCENM